MVERVSVASLLDGHVSLAVDSFDRLLLNGYVPTLQTAGAVVRFLTEHRGNQIPSPALFTRSVTPSVLRSNSSPPTVTSPWPGSPDGNASWTSCAITWSPARRGCG